MMRLRFASLLKARRRRLQEYKAAAEDQHRKNSKPGLMTGLFNSLDGPSEGEASEHSPGSGSLSLQAPRPSQEVTCLVLLRQHGEISHTACGTHSSRWSCQLQRY